MPEPKNEPASVPIERWIPHRPFDSAEYLEGEPPTYADPDDAGEFGPSADKKEKRDG